MSSVIEYRPVLSLKPTQFALGMLEVDEKIKSMLELSKKDRKKLVAETIIPVIHAPGGQYYIVDRHHFLCSCYHVGIKEVRVEVIKDLSHKQMTFSRFWKWMSQHRSSYPFCQFGEGPRNEIYLPRDIRGLADDPYRSLAWFVRKSGAFENSEKNFAEFTWANFFRSKKLLDRAGMAGFEQALMKALKLAQSPEAKNLPGFGKLNLSDQLKTKNAAKKKIKEARKSAKLLGKIEERWM